MNAILKSAGGLVVIAVAGAAVLSHRLQSPAVAPAAPQVAAAPQSPLPPMRPLPSDKASAAKPAPEPRPQGGAVVLKAGAGGHYVSGFDLNGRRIEMLVDTGASVVALSHEDAQKIGMTPFPSDYTLAMSTANGVVKAAQKTISEVRIDTIVVRDVQAVIMPPGALRTSLLGMSFLQRLSGFEIVGGDRLYLKP